MADGNPAPPADTAFHPEDRRAGRGDIIPGERVYLSALDKAGGSFIEDAPVGEVTLNP